MPAPVSNAFADFPGLGAAARAALDDQFAAGAPAAHSRLFGRVLNVRPDPIDVRDVIYRPGLRELPSWLAPPDLAALGLPVRDQGAEGACTGQALAAVIDLQNARRFREGADVPRRISARMLYEAARSYDEYADDALPGSSARGAIKGFYAHGACSAALAPYIPGDVGWRMTVARAKDARRTRLGTYFRLRHVLNDYHVALAEAGAIFCAAIVHENWAPGRVAGGVIRFDREARPAIRGAHAFAIVGYTPDGLVVLNSWGAGWGGLHDDRLGADPLPGMALWTYEDWQAHVLDAWVLRLQVPSRLPSGFLGGFDRDRAATEALGKAPAPRPAAKQGAGDIRGHFVNVDDGRFDRTPPYDNDIGTFAETARHLVEDGGRARPQYDHLLFFGHGGLNDLDAAAQRVLAMRDGFKRNRIYPVFFLWRTGIRNITGDLLRNAWDEALGRAGFVSAFTDPLIEKVARPIGRRIWAEMKADATLAFDGTGDRGAAWAAFDRLRAAALEERPTPLSLHFVGHSAGAILLGHLFARARAAGVDLRPDTVSLLAPAARWDFFTRTLVPVTRRLPAGAFAVYNLDDAAERRDTVSGVYRKSLLYLVSQALEAGEAAPIVGMDRFWAAHRKPRGIGYHLAGRKRDGIVASLSESHGGFDNDATTMNHVLGRVLGHAAAQPFRPEELSESLF